jgi:hypothetical protein
MIDRAACLTTAKQAEREDTEKRGFWKKTGLLV